MTTRFGVLGRVRSLLHLHARRGYESVIRRRDGGRVIRALLVVIVIGFGTLVVIQRLDTIRRTASAEITIVATELDPGSRFEQSPTGKWLVYYYMVDGSTYPGRDFRRWLNIAAHEPKVCYDPANPSDHLLVEGNVTCGA